MALIDCNFYSEVLGLSTTMRVILPDIKRNKKDNNEEEYPTLYLLHGLSDNYTGWTRQTSIERYLRKYNLAAVMPMVHRSFYTDMEYGYDYWTFISEEVMQVARKYFPLSSKREDNFVAGLSMGGYGAFKMGLRCPDKFKAAASLSGALDIVSLYKQNEKEEESLKDFDLIYGDIEKLKNSKNDLLYLLKDNVEKNRELPLLYQCCGTEDFLYEINQNFKNLAQRLEVDLVYEEELGIHEWGYWDKKIQRVLEWLPVENIEEGNM